jgi:threonine dehydrogenase-like Zn-dependent dehydrogenase
VLHGVARSNIKPDDRVVVLGDGAIGLMFVATLAHKGYLKCCCLVAMISGCKLENNWVQLRL